MPLTSLSVDELALVVGALDNVQDVLNAASSSRALNAAARHLLTESKFFKAQKKRLGAFLRGVDRALTEAAIAIARADAMVIGTGAGMGVDSGLGTFRGSNAAVWPPLKAMGIDISEMSCPDRLEDDPRVAWAFWKWRYDAYTGCAPHKGYHLLAEWGARCLRGFRSITSNIDGHWIRTPGVGEARTVEMHGALTHMQHVKPSDRGEIWDATREHYSALNVQRRTCWDEARPNVLMFGETDDGTEGSQFNWQRLARQEEQFKRWWADVCAGGPHSKVVVVEVGAGTKVPTIREICEDLVFGEKPGSGRPRKLARPGPATLVRINLDEPNLRKLPCDDVRRAVGVGGLGALQALRMIDVKIAVIRRHFGSVDLRC